MQIRDLKFFAIQLCLRPILQALVFTYGEMMGWIAPKLSRLLKTWKVHLKSVHGLPFTNRFLLCLAGYWEGLRIACQYLGPQRPLVARQTRSNFLRVHPSQESTWIAIFHGPQWLCLEMWLIRRFPFYF